MPRLPSARWTPSGGRCTAAPTRPWLAWQWGPRSGSGSAACRWPGGRCRPPPPPGACPRRPSRTRASGWWCWPRLAAGCTWPSCCACGSATSARSTRAAGWSPTRRPNRWPSATSSASAVGPSSGSPSCRSPPARRFSPTWTSAAAPAWTPGQTRRWSRGRTVGPPAGRAWPARGAAPTRSSAPPAPSTSSCVARPGSSSANGAFPAPGSLRPRRPRPRRPRPGRRPLPRPGRRRRRARVKTVRLHK